MAKNGHKRRQPALIAIGGHEDKEHDKVILRKVAERVGPRRLVVATLASEQAGAMIRDYERVFHSIGVRDVVHLNIDERLDASDDPRLKLLENAGGIFFTGGDQLRLTSKLGGTALCDRIHRLYLEGAVIAGTSAGASVLTETMIVSGEERSHRINDVIGVAPGLGFLSGMVIDQHFAERGRVGRLLGIVAQNPRAIGIGIDENTAVVVHETRMFEVIGAGAVYVIDGRPITYTNVSEQDTNRTMSVFDVRVHLLAAGDCFDLVERRPRIDSKAGKVEHPGATPES